MPNALRFSYAAVGSAIGEMSYAPKLPLKLVNFNDFAYSISAIALVDSGAAVNVLPYHIGIELGAVWDPQAKPLNLSGNMASIEAQILLTLGIVGDFPATPLVFAWCKRSDVPLILGQTNFFIEYDVCFFRSTLVFEISPKQQQG